jgi:DNA polymerase phi
MQQLERRNPAELAEDEAELEPSSESGPSDGDSGDEGSDDSTGDNEDPDPEIRKELEEIVQYNGADATGDDTNDESEEEKLMDDDQMMAMDERLAAVFRERAKTRSTKSSSPQIFFAKQLH